MPLRPNSRMRYALPLGGALLASAVGVAAYAAHAISGPHKRNGEAFGFSPWETGIEYEQVQFTTADGVNIRGWWFPRAGTDEVVIALHGHRGTKTQLLGIGSGLWRAGNNVLLFDYRGCGDSDSGRQSLAHHELLDAQAAVRYVEERVPDAKVGVIGYSMGAALAILLTAREPAIRAVVADSPFATMRDVIAYAYRRRRLPSQPLLELTDALTRWRYGYAFAAVRPLEVIRQIAPRPLLLLHGTADAVIPIEHTHRLFEAASEPKELWIFEGATHCGGYFADRRRYVARVAEFFRQGLGGTIRE